MDTVNVSNPQLSDYNVFNFNGAPPDVTGGTLIIYALGDIDNSYEAWDIFDEQGSIIGSIGGSGAPCTVQMISIPLTAVDLLNWSMDGTITFEGIDVSGVDINTSLCGNDYLEMVLEICTALDCNGSEISLEATGIGSYTTVFEDDFENGYGSGWQSPANGNFTNPCEPSYDGGTYLWVGDGVLSPRSVTTLPLDVTCGGEICFYLDFAIQAENPPCEGIDLPDEGVYLEYSTDGGVTWNTIEYYGPAGVGNYTDAGGNDPQMTTWNQYCASIPPGAFSANTQFQWIQTGASGIDNDQWGLDNVNIIAYDYCAPYTYDWSHIQGNDDPSSDTDTLNATYTYYVTYSNGFESCTDSVTIEIPDGIYVDAGPDQLICDGIGPVVLGGNPTAWGGTSGVFFYSWDPVNDLNDPSVANPTANPASSTLYTVTVTDGNNCSETDQVWVNIDTSPVVSAGNDVTICEGDSAMLSANGAVSYLWSPTVGLTDSTSAAITASPSSTTIYTVTGYSTLGCSNTDNVTVTVESIPVVNAGPDLIVCQGDQVTLTGSGTPGITYTWDNGVQDGIPFIPSGTTVYEVTGTSANGCISTDQLMVTVNPIPNVQSSNVTVCEGDTVDLSATGAQSYVWSPGTFLNQTTGATVECVPSNSIIYTVTGTDANGCSDSAQVQVTVNPVPTPVINGQSSYCTGSFASLSTSINYASYNWSTGSNSTTVNVVDSDSPVEVQVTNAYGCTGTSAPFIVVEDTVIINQTTIEVCQGDSALIHGNWENTAGVYSDTLPSMTTCDSISNVSLNIHSSPIIDAGPDVSVCEGEQVLFFATGASQVTWSNGVLNGDYAIAPVGNNFYTVEGTDDYGCVGTDNFQVTVFGLPNVSAGPDMDICDGDSIVLQGTGASNYVWSNGVTNGMYFTPALGATSYTVTGTDFHGCVNSDDLTIIVHNLPTVYGGADITICEGESVILSGAGADSYFWDNNVVDGIPFYPSIDTTYNVIGVDAYGCSDTDQVVVNVSGPPLAFFTVDTLSGCAPLTVEFTNLSQGNQSSCVWTIGTTTYQNNCEDITYEFSQEGSYTVSLEVTNAYGCSDQFSLGQDIVVSSTPVVSFWPSLSQMTTLDTEVNFYNSSVGADTYLWFFGDGSATSTEFEPSHSFPDDEEGVYEVILIGTSDGGCTDSAVAYIKVDEELIFFVPNSFTPDQDGFNEMFTPVFTTGFDPFDFTMYIFDRWGDLIFESHDASKGWNGKLGGADGRPAQDGTYTWKIVYKRTGVDKHESVTGHVNLLK